MIFFSRTLRFLLVAWRVFSSKVLLTFYRVAYYPNLIVEAGVSLQEGVRISVSDGGEIHLGQGVAICANTKLVAKRGRISIAGNSYIGPQCMLVSGAEIVIGKNALIAERVSIRDQEHGFKSDTEIPYRSQPMESSPIYIGENVWLGASCFITKGVEIGENVVVGANSVVTNNLNSQALYAGAPAKLIRQL